MTDHRLNELLNAQCALPFDLLGMRKTSSGVTITCWFPGATRVEAVSWLPIYEPEERVSRVMEPLHEDGLFQLKLKTSDALVAESSHCRFRVEYGDKVYDKLDPYQFSDITFHDFHYDAATLYRNQGAHLSSREIQGQMVEGVRFAVYAPHARSVSVVGDFNHWDGRIHPMGASGDGIWRLFIPDSRLGDRYKFEIKSQQGDLLPHKVDPMAFSIDQHPSFACVVYDHQRYQWQDLAWQEKEVTSHLSAPINIYEVHMGSWRFQDGRPMSYQELTRELIPYVQEMGYTHIELLPISEYPYGASWGYQPVGLFAPTSRYGSPDDFKAFVDACHQAGIGVILDWVPAHFPTDSHGLSNFDGTPLYEYPDPRKGWHQEWNSLIYDYGREHVCQFLISNALYWFDCFHIDGIRVDAVASMLYLDYSRKDGEWVANQFGGNHNLEAIAFIKRLNETIYLNYPKAMTIAEESTAFPGVSKPTFEGGLGFGFKWNMGWMNDSLRYMSRDHIYRKYHHNELTFGMMYAFSEHFVLPLSHDEVVHGKRSLLYKMPGDEWQKFANLRAFSAYLYAHPGKMLNFMGSEIAQSNEWDFNRPLSWELLEYELHQGQQKVIRDLNHLYRNEPCLYEQDFHPDGFRWLAPDDSGNSVLSMIRFATNRDDHLIILINMTPMPREHYAIGVPRNCHYKVVLNTDSVYYGGSNYPVGDDFRPAEKALHQQPYSIALNIPPLSAVILKPQPDNQTGK
ncbi:1,4-alpha-glucan branching enzyme [Hahella sp. CCB-MM4]|uniref:1,4-alpha-glucan branching protein GlgB n=1 Tax=Hahella sp. (strain CCB-MM4) TaxID=1926491 RepID=UPI000B9BE905|nr:1,4-alpha-glucan branching protein GlgB [Hahella sp. CCB-MM4]OZG72351.1 1,4-alpha-glucan branching enzyme [Hahella sp. CCB-MM4]